MRWRLMLVAALLATACSPAATETAAPAATETTAETAQTAAVENPAADPIPVVEAIYTPYLTNNFLEAATTAPFSADLAALRERAVAASADDEIGVMDFDPFIDGQDFQIANLVVTADQPPAEGRVSVTARFSNFGTPSAVTYDLVAENGAWKVDNVRTNAWNLRSILAEAMP